MRRGRYNRRRSQADKVHRRDRKDTDLRTRRERDSRERTDGEKTFEELWDVWHKAGVLEPAGKYRIAPPGGQALLLRREAPGCPPTQSRSREVTLRAISARLAGLLYPSNAHLGSGQGLGPGKTKT